MVLTHKGIEHYSPNGEDDWKLDRIGKLNQISELPFIGMYITNFPLKFPKKMFEAAQALYGDNG